jgi:LacI family transcriptional regulator
VFKARINGGEDGLGDGVRIKDVAKAAGVAVGTVSRVLNNHATVTESIRRKVESAILATGYELDLTAQSMRGQRSRLVACAIRDFDIPRFATFIKEAESVLRGNGYTLLLSSTTNRPEVELALLRTFERRKVDGVMMTISDEAHSGVLSALGAVKMPVLLIDRDRIETTDRVTADHRLGAKLATDHLLGLGHRRIGILVGDANAFPSRARLEGFGDAYAEVGLEPDLQFVRRKVLTPEDAFRETVSLMSSPTPPTALFVAAMDMLGGSLRALRTLRRGVGNELSIVAGSDSELAELHTPSITAVAWDLAEMGRHAATLLLERMRGEAPASHRCLVLPTKLIIRDSCRPPDGRR